MPQPVPPETAESMPVIARTSIGLFGQNDARPRASCCARHGGQQHGAVPRAPHPHTGMSRWCTPR